MPKESSRTTPAAPPEQPVPESYEAAVQELEQLVRTMESGDVPLDGLLSGYQRGAWLLQYCREKLQAVEDQIKVLDDGVLKPWKGPSA
jgi:exodeoxyribonuclease VII small subunit